MKKFICGFLAGAMIFGAIGTFAVSYVAEQASFKVMVNGSEFVSDKPIVAIDGSTYLPLKAIGEVLNVPVKWNDELHQVEVGETPTAETTNTENTATTDEEITEVVIRTKSIDEVYKENPNIVNLGYILEKDAYKAEETDGKMIYYYDTSDYVLNPLRSYEYVLEGIGYSVSCDGKTLSAFSLSNLTDFSYYIRAEMVGDKVFVLFEKIN